MKKIIALILAVITILTLALSLVSCDAISGNDPKGLTKAFVKAYLKPDIKKYNSYKLIPMEDEIKYYAEQDGMTVEEYLEEKYDCSSLEEYYADKDVDFKDDLEDIYGEYDCEVRTIKVDEYTPKELNSFQKSIELSTASEYSDIDSTRIDAAAKCEVKIRIKGEEKSATVSLVLIVVKYNGKWKVYSYSYDN